MLALSSEDKNFIRYAITNIFPLIVLDVETLDCKGKSNEPIVSFSISLPEKSFSSWESPTVSFICEDLDEEEKLLEILNAFMRINRGSLFAGHNISFHFKNIFPWKYGFDFPKIAKRAHHFGMNLDFLKDVSVYDSMDVAFKCYDHSTHNFLHNGEKQRILSCEHLEAGFKIKRPIWLPKLGSKVREHYKRYQRDHDLARLRRLCLYNACDTIIESVIIKIFMHFTNGECKSKTISPYNCSHTPKEFNIETNPTWIRLQSNKITKI